MPAAKKPSKKPSKKPARKPGRPTKYLPDQHPGLAYRALRRLGLDDPALAEVLGISRKTLNNWREEHQPFLLACQKGRDEHDTLNVERTLLERAMGYEYEEEIHELRPVYEERDGKRVQIGTDLVLTERRHKKQAPDVTAQIHWLKNRHPDRWNDRRELFVDVDDRRTGVMLVGEVLEEEAWEKEAAQELGQELDEKQGDDG